VALHEKARADNLVSDARQALKEEAPLPRLRELTGELQQVYHGLGAASGPAGGPPGAPQGDGGDDVIDAEFTPNE
jgi:molecular chaperone DnaK